jgi:hypothetical protein
MTALRMYVEVMIVSTMEPGVILSVPNLLLRGMVVSAEIARGVAREHLRMFQQTNVDPIVSMTLQEVHKANAHLCALHITRRIK